MRERMSTPEYHAEHADHAKLIAALGEAGKKLPDLAETLSKMNDRRKGHAQPEAVQEKYDQLIAASLQDALLANALLHALHTHEEEKADAEEEEDFDRSEMEPHEFTLLAKWSDLLEEMSYIKSHPAYRSSIGSTMSTFDQAWGTLKAKDQQRLRPLLLEHLRHRLLSKPTEHH